MAFTPRTNSYGIYGDPKWYAQNPYFSAFQMPNCTAYAYGRFWEIMGSKPTGLPSADAGNWYPLVTAYQKGNIPAKGAIICWSPDNVATSSYKGHVAIVEDVRIVNGHYELTISESGWLPDSQLTQMTGVTCNRSLGILPQIVSDTSIVNWYWKNDNSGKVLTSENNYFLERRPMYHFQGFIYPPDTSGVVPPTNWEHVETWQYSALNQAQLENNATLIYMYLRSCGFALNTIAGILGNIETEGQINPGQTEHSSYQLPQYNQSTGVPTNTYFLPDRSAFKGLGLCGWTAWSGADENIVLKTAMNQNKAWYDGDMQCELINQIGNLGYWTIRAGWNISWNDFKTNANGWSPEDLASAFLYNFENPDDPVSSEPIRRSQATNWYNYLINIDSGGDYPLNPSEYKTRKMPLWFLLRYC